MPPLPTNLTERQPNTQYVASISYGKDSLAMLEAIKILGLPLDRIIHAEVWATDEISADLPPMCAFKEKADRIIKERYGIEVEHVCARDKDGNKITYEKLFYKVPKRKPNNKKFAGGGRTILGFPMLQLNWCTSNLKRAAIREVQRLPRYNRSVVQKTQNRLPRTSLEEYTVSRSPCEEETGARDSNKNLFLGRH